MNIDRKLHEGRKKCSVRDGLHDRFYDLNRKKLQEHLLANGTMTDPYHSDTVTYKMPLGYSRYEEVYDPNAGRQQMQEQDDSGFTGNYRRTRKYKINHCRRVCGNQCRGVCNVYAPWGYKGLCKERCGQVCRGRCSGYYSGSAYRPAVYRSYGGYRYFTGDQPGDKIPYGYHMHPDGTSNPVVPTGEHKTHNAPQSKLRNDYNRGHPGSLNFLKSGVKGANTVDYPKPTVMYERAAPTGHGPYMDGGMSRGLHDHKIGPDGLSTRYNDRNKVRTHESLHKFSGKKSNPTLMQSRGSHYPSLENPYAYTKQQRMHDLVRYSIDHDASLVAPTSCPYNVYNKYLKSGRFGNHHGVLNDDSSCAYC